MTLATQNSAERMTLPQSSYVKASDVFGGACMAFVFSVILGGIFLDAIADRETTVFRR